MYLLLMLASYAVLGFAIWSGLHAVPEFQPQGYVLAGVLVLVVLGLTVSIIRRILGKS